MVQSMRTSMSKLVCEWEVKRMKELSYVSDKKFCLLKSFGGNIIKVIRLSRGLFVCLYVFGCCVI